MEFYLLICCAVTSFSQSIINIVQFQSLVSFCLRLLPGQASNTHSDFVTRWGQIADLKLEIIVLLSYLSLENVINLLRNKIFL